jgi:hypothetical protein
VPGRNDDKNMSATIPYESELIRGGPPFWLQKWLHLITPGDPKIARRAIVVVVVGWLPLLLLALVQGLAWHGGTEGSFLLDFAVHARSLVAAPLFIIAEAFCIPRLGAQAIRVRSWARRVRSRASWVEREACSLLPISSAALL